MRNLEKLKYEIIGMEETLKKKPNPKLFNKLTGLRFKLLRLEQGMTAEAVVQDNKIYFKKVLKQTYLNYLLYNNIMV